jgi:hypothetical protein
MIGLILLAALATPPAHCPPVSVAVAKGMPPAFSARFVGQASANFAKAYAKACGEGLLKKKALVTAKDKHLFLSNAPEANIASIYKSGGRMVLEFPFVSEDRKANVPSVDDLHEAIFCAVHGASAKEQEESGRCLPD